MGNSRIRVALGLSVLALLLAAPAAFADEDHGRGDHDDHHPPTVRHDRDDHKPPVVVAPKPPTVIVVHDPAPAPAPPTIIVVHDPAPAPIVVNPAPVNVIVNVPADGDGSDASTPTVDPPSTSSSSASSSAYSGGGSGGISDDAGRLAACHYEPATAPKLQGGTVVPGTPAGYQLRWLFRYQTDQYVNASSPDYLSLTGDCGPGSNPAVV